MGIYSWELDQHVFAFHRCQVHSTRRSLVVPPGLSRKAASPQPSMVSISSATVAPTCPADFDEQSAVRRPRSSPARPADRLRTRSHDPPPAMSNAPSRLAGRGSLGISRVRKIVFFALPCSCFSARAAAITASFRLSPQTITQRVRAIILKSRKIEPCRT